MTKKVDREKVKEFYLLLLSDTRYLASHERVLK